MTLKQNFAEQLKAQSDIWRAQAKDYQEHMDQAGAGSRRVQESHGDAAIEDSAGQCSRSALLTKT
jgi:hypothetical protein